MDERLLRDLLRRLERLERTSLRYRKDENGIGLLVSRGIEIRLTFEPLAGGLPSHDGKRGDIVFDTLPSAGGTVGAVCTTAPSTWKRFGSIAA